jgi:dolichol-phosphate mannosyltransferase
MRNLVSIVIPVYNEALAIREILRRVLAAPLPEWAEIEIVIVDDGSNDTTVNLIQEFIKENPETSKLIRLHQGLVNHGKGAALRAGFKLAQGRIIIVQDGDLEYSPNDYSRLLQPFEDEETQIVYGSRFTRGIPRGMKFWNAVANRILSLAVQLLFAHPITDEATGYKVFRKEILSQLDLKCRRFEFCPEFTAKVLRRGYSIIEVPINYNPRGIFEGKKIKARDGFQALWTLVKYRLIPVRRDAATSQPSVRAN